MAFEPPLVENVTIPLMTIEGSGEYGAFRGSILLFLFLALPRAFGLLPQVFHFVCTFTELEAQIVCHSHVQSSDVGNWLICILQLLFTCLYFFSNHSNEPL